MCRLDIELLRDKNAELSSNVSELNARLFEALLQPHKSSVEEILAGRGRSSVSTRVIGQKGGLRELDSSDEENYQDVIEPAQDNIPIAMADIKVEVDSNTKDPSSVLCRDGGGIKRITVSDMRANKKLSPVASTGALAIPLGESISAQEKEIAELREVCGSLQHIVNSYEDQFQKMQVMIRTLSPEYIRHRHRHSLLHDNY